MHSVEGEIASVLFDGYEVISVIAQLLANKNRISGNIISFFIESPPLYGLIVQCHGEKTYTKS